MQKKNDVKSNEKKRKVLIIRFFTIYQNKLQEQGIQDVVNISNTMIGPYGGLGYQVDSKFKETLINN